MVSVRERTRAVNPGENKSVAAQSGPAKDTVEVVRVAKEILWLESLVELKSCSDAVQQRSRGDDDQVPGEERSTSGKTRNAVRRIRKPELERGRGGKEER